MSDRSEHCCYRRECAEQALENVRLRAEVARLRTRLGEAERFLAEFVAVAADLERRTIRAIAARQAAPKASPAPGPVAGNGWAGLREAIAAPPSPAPAPAPGAADAVPVLCLSQLGCVRPDGHGGLHRSPSGVEWERR